LPGERPIKAETLEISFSGKWGVDASKISPFFEIALVLVRLDHGISASRVTLSSSRKAVLEFSNEMPFWFV
jgi:hypothetical protein